MLLNALNTIYFPDWYWIVGDNSPATTVFSTASSPPQFVANNNASFLSWLARDITGAASGNGTNMPILAAANNGSGKTRLTLKDTSSLATSQRFWFGATNGVQQITVIDGTHIDLTGLNFSSWVSTPAMLGATIIPTLAQLGVSLNRASFTTSQPGAISFLGMTSDQTLTNPPPFWVVAQPTGAPRVLKLPPMNAPNSLAVGQSITFLNIGGFQLNIQDTNGTPILGLPVDPDILILTLTSNATAGGTYLSYNISVIGQTGQLSQGQVWASGGLPNTNALGELLEAQQATPQTLTTNTPLSLASITLSTGEWDVRGVVNFNGNAATTVNYFIGSLHTVANTLGSALSDGYTAEAQNGATTFNNLANEVLPVGPMRFTGGQTVRITVQAGFGVSTCQATAKMTARRVA